MTWQGGGSYRWYLNSVSGGPYTQSLLAVSGTLNLNDATLTSANRFTIRPDSLSLSNADGAVYDFDPNTPYSWTVATFTAVSGFSPDKFTIDTSAFTPATTADRFALSQSGNSLVLTFTPAPVPEPAGLLGLCALGLAAAGFISRSRRKGMPGQNEVSVVGLPPASLA
jgi:hypothetical protein